MSPLEIVILLPLLAALAIWLGAPARFTSLGAAVVNLLIVFGLVFSFKSASAGKAGFAFESARVVLDNPAITFGVGADGVALILALLTALVTFAAVWHISTDKPAIYHIASMLIAGGALGAELASTRGSTPLAKRGSRSQAKSKPAAAGWRGFCHDWRVYHPRQMK